MSSVGEYLMVNAPFAVANLCGAVFVAVRQGNFLPLAGVSGSLVLHSRAIMWIEKKTTRNSTKSLLAAVASNALATATWFVGLPWLVTVFSGCIGTGASLVLLLLSGFVA